jgi:hypothetical protein
MSPRIASSLVFGSLVSVLVAVSACNGGVDDTTLTARAQSSVNQAVTTDSEIQVNADDGTVTLSGVASSDKAHEHALAAARSTEGVRSVVDHIATPGTLTGATVPSGPKEPNGIAK